MFAVYVIIPVYNGERYIKAAVQSVLRQPYSNIGIVLIDDGSKDSSLRICRDLERKYDNIQVIHKENHGVSSARNSGIEYVMGVDLVKEDCYLAFLDADDLWDEDVITDDLVRKICSEKQDIISFSCYYANAAANRVAVHNAYHERLIMAPERGTTEWLINGHLGANLYRGSLIRDNKLRFMESIKYNEDVIFSRQALFCAESVQLREEFLHIYRMNTSSVTHKTRYSPQTAAGTAMAWYNVIDWADHIEVSSVAKNNWKAFCRSISASRLLEAAGSLAEAGYRDDEIREFVYAVPFYEQIAQLTIDEMAPWQKQELILFRQDFAGYCQSHRRRGMIKRLVGIWLKYGPLNKLREIKKYPIKRT